MEKNEKVLWLDPVEGIEFRGITVDEKDNILIKLKLAQGTILGGVSISDDNRVCIELLNKNPKKVLSATVKAKEEKEEQIHEEKAASVEELKEEIREETATETTEVTNSVEETKEEIHEETATETTEVANSVEEPKGEILEETVTATTKVTNSVEEREEQIHKGYSEKTQNETIKVSESNDTASQSSSNLLRKPSPLVGGSEVYQMSGIPYWYCKIKNGRDTFMCFYTDDLTEKDILTDSFGRERTFVTNNQKNFKQNALKALKNKPRKGYVWISAYEPSPAKKGGIQFVAGQKPYVGIRYCQWEAMCEEYSLENESHQISKDTVFLLLLRWLKDGIATFEQLSDNSSEIGYYRDTVDAKEGVVERTGKRGFGGLFGFVGNTEKIVKDPESMSGVSSIGGSSDSWGSMKPISRVTAIREARYPSDDGLAFVELEK